MSFSSFNFKINIYNAHPKTFMGSENLLSYNLDNIELREDCLSKNEKIIIIGNIRFE